MSTPEQKRSWYLKNRERILSEKRAGYDSEKERIAQRAYRARNPDYNSRRRAAYAARPAAKKAVAAAQRSYLYYANRDRILEQSRKARAKLGAGYWRSGRGLPEPTRPAPEVCESCGRTPAGRFKVLSLDHCHATGKFRGWLCNMCNRGIGALGDTLEGVERAVDYLKRAQSL